MMCSQCQIGRAWDAQGRCRPCSIGNVNLGAPSAPGAAPSVAALAAAPQNPARPAVASSTRASGGACSQCWIGVAWDEQGRCRPCSDGGVQLAPAAAPDPEDEEAEPQPSGGRRRWFGERR